MCVEAAADTRLGAVDPIDAPNGERKDSAQLGHRELPTRVSTLGDVDELDERGCHELSEADWNTHRRSIQYFKA